MIKWVTRLLLLLALALPAATLFSGCVSVGDSDKPLVDIDVEK